MAVYFIRAGEDGPVKIGYAKNVVRRMAMLQSANPANLTLIREVDGGRVLECWFHRLFADYRLDGEWFSFNEEMLTRTASQPVFPVVASRRKRVEKPNKLSSYLAAQGLSVSEFASLVGLSGASVSRLKRGLQWPDKDTVRRIELATGGQVTANDFAGMEAA